MSESNNVKFVEAGGKWLWKRYDVEGSVIFRSPLFNTEREAREDYEINGAGPISSIQLWCGRIGDGQGGGFDCPKSFKHYRQPYLSFGLNLQYK
jgi:hypothetical protein